MTKLTKEEKQAKIEQNKADWETFKVEHPTAYKWLKIAGLIFIGIVIGGMMFTPEPSNVRTVTETKEVEVVVEKTPQACKDVLALDDEVYAKIATALEQFDFEPATQYIMDNTDRRNNLYFECVSQ